MGIRTRSTRTLGYSDSMPSTIPCIFGHLCSLSLIAELSLMNQEAVHLCQGVVRADEVGFVLLFETLAAAFRKVLVVVEYAARRVGGEVDVGSVTDVSQVEHAQNIHPYGLDLAAWLASGKGLSTCRDMRTPETYLVILTPVHVWPARDACCVENVRGLDLCETPAFCCLKSHH